VAKLPEHGDDHQIADRKPALKPLLIAQRLGQQIQPNFEFLDDLRPTFLRPVLAAIEDVDVDQFEQHRLDAVQRSDQPGDGPHPLIEVARKQSLILKSEMNEDRAAFEQLHLLILVGRNLPERLFAEVIGRPRIHRIEQTDPVGPLDFFECPADAQIAD
jgi:hypothetical protein